ncbi:hypothetical protein NADE_003362 [Nannochloris sp. 'desiccata']|nr:hypothetical protein KSW81_000606 [Chlorella desiccata (nom. nud.)]KAH7620749.1 hypothetical protein NADE_003362 [Chlorella desiccata (nom. nud.)]
MANNQQLLRELEQALASQAALKQQRADIIHTVATSPSKKKKVPAPAPRPQPSKKQGPPKQQLIPAGRHAAQQNSKPSSRTTIPAFRPPSPTDSQDTIGREIDAAITKSVANMLHTPVPSQQLGPRIVALPALANARASQQQPQQQEQALTPLFLTAKRRNMHCELDEPGYGVPFPHRKQKGFFAKLFSFSCFAPRQTRGGGGHGPPSPFLIRTPTRPRPLSAKVTPPTLKLTSEMAPLRQSLASLKPGLAAAALADGAQGYSRGVHASGHGINSATAIALSEQQQPLSSGGTPPTPQFGTIAGNLAFPPRNRDTWITQGDHLNASTPQHEELHSEASFESLEAELSDHEGGLVTPGAAMYRRTPVAGADGRPLVQKRHQEEQVPGMMPEQLQQQQQQPSQLQRQSSEIRGTEEAHAQELQSALIQALSVPLPPQAGQMGQRKPSNGGAKQTQVTLAALMDPKNNNSYFKSHHHLQQQQQQGGYYQDIRSAPVSPQKRGGVVVNSKSPRQQQIAAAQVAPVGASAAPIPSLQEQQQQYHRPQVQSAPASRAVSPLRQPTIKPRMTKASSARSEATQRLLENRRKREMAHLANLHPRAAKRKEGSMLNHNPSRGSSIKSDEVMQVKRPRSAQTHPSNDEITEQGRVGKEEAVNIAAGALGADGYHLPAAGTRAVLKKIQQQYPNISAVNSLIVPDNNNLAATSIPVPPRSPGFYQMLERLALGMSVDLARVEEAKKPTKSFVPMEESFVEEGGVKNSNQSDSNAVATSAEMQKRGSIKEDDGFVFNPNALFSGKAELSPLVNVAAQKLVSLSDAVVARSASGSVVATKEGEEVPPSPPAAAADVGIVVDASSSTLLGQLMELERSLTLSDLAALRHAIRREGGAAEAWTE